MDSRSYTKPIFAGLMDVAIRRSMAYAGAERVKFEVYERIVARRLAITIMQDDSVLGFCTMDPNAYGHLIDIIEKMGLTPGVEYARFEGFRLLHPEARAWLGARIAETVKADDALGPDHTPRP